jgi:hypothetical protein
MPVILAIWKAEIRRIPVGGQPLSPKITRSKWTQGGAQAVEHLCEALNLNLSPGKRGVTE